MSSNIAAVVTRLVALAGDISGVDTARDGWPNVPITSSDLPMIVVEDGDATYQRASHFHWIATRPYELTTLVREMVTGRPDLDLAGRQASRAWSHTVANAFMKTPRLERGDAGLAGVRVASVQSGTRPGGVEHGGIAFWAVATILQIETMHNRDE